MDRRILAIGLATISACLIFVAIFVDRAGSMCLPEAVLGAAPAPSPSASVWQGSKADLAALDALVKAGGSPELTIYADQAKVTFCRSKEWALAMEIVASIVAALAVGLWTAMRRPR